MLLLSRHCGRYIHQPVRLPGISRTGFRPRSGAGHKHLAVLLKHLSICAGACVGASPCNHFSFKEDLMKHPILADNPGDRQLLLGNEAIVRGALEAGINMVTCYPGTPSSEVPDTFYRLRACGRYRMEYSTNEKVALEVGAGASLAGAMTLVTMKHVGVNVAADPLFTLSYTDRKSVV